MQKFLYTLCFFFSALYASSQITGFGYQGAARDVSGHVIASTQVSLRFSLLEGTVAGAELYVETQSTMTNLQGVFTVTVGNGVGVSGNFNSINWASEKFLKVEIAISGGAFVLAGTTQILSAPTAYYAQKAKQLDTSANIDVGSKNVVNMANPIGAQDGATKNYVDVQIASDNDKSATNEIQNLDNVLTVSNSAGGKKISDLSDPTIAQDAATKNYVDVQITADNALDNDKSETNEIQNLDDVLTVNNSAGSKKITNLSDPTIAQDAATKNYVDAQIIADNALDNDKSATNEIQDLVLVSGALRITNNPAFTQINLAPFQGTNTDEQNLDNVLAFGNSAGSQKITNLLNPTGAQDAATKNYVDTQIATDNSLDNDKSATNEIQNLDNVLTVNNSAGNKGITDLLNPTAAQDAATKNYVDAQVAADNALDADKSVTNEIQNLDNVLTVNNSAGNKNITNLLNPTTAQDAATKNYVDALVAADNVLDADKSATNEIQNLDNVLTVNNSAGNKNITNLLNPTTAQDAATKNYVDAQVAADNVLDADKSATNEIQNLDNVLTVNNSAGNKSITNLLDPAVAQDAATKNYVDAQIALDNDKSAANELQNLDAVLDISNSAGGNRITNLLDPSASQDAATKNYVDAQIAADNALDIDKSATNEIQNLDNVLTVSNNAGNKSITNLLNPVGAQDAATKNYVDTQGALGWNYTGNTISDPTTQFIGTINSEPLTFRSNNIERMRLSPGGNLGIGTSIPLQLFHVRSNNTPSDIVFDDAVLDGFAEISLGSAIESNANNTSNGNGALASVITSGGSSPQYSVIAVAKGANTGNSTGVLAAASGSTGTNRGLYGRATGSSTGSNSFGVQSFANGTNDRAYGGYFVADGTATSVNAGLWSDAIGNSPFNYGVWARAANSTNVNAAGIFRKEGTAGTDNYGVSAIATAGISGSTRGGYFEVDENNGTGVATGLYAMANGSGTGNNNGIYAAASGGSVLNRAGFFEKTGTAGTDNYGIHAIATSGLAGLTRGGYFEVLNNNGTGAATGVLANVSGTGTGSNNGVFATVSGGSSTNRAGLFQKTGATGTNNYGVAGIAVAGLTGITRGGYFEVEDNNGAGTGYGIYSTINGTGTGTNYGGYFAITGNNSNGYGVYVTANGTGNNRGIYAEATGGSTNTAGEFVGEVTISQRVTIGTVMRLTPLSVAPTSPVKGEIYFDNNDNTVKYWNGTVWVTM